MSAQLDKSLDEIISSNRPKKTLKKNNKSNKVGKQQVAKKQPKKPVANSRRNGPAQVISVAAPASDVSYASKAVVHNLPKDIKQDDIKEFFQSQVGGVKTVALSYNERGQSKGIATIIFNKSSFLTKAFEKFNGAPIDQGSAKLRVELIVDPTRKPLSARITANPTNVAAVAKQVRAAQKPAAKKQAAAKKPAQKKKPAKKPKKTIEDLDKEMADYFEEK